MKIILVLLLLIIVGIIVAVAISRYESGKETAGEYAALCRRRNPHSTLTHTSLPAAEYLALCRRRHPHSNLSHTPYPLRCT